MKMVKVASRDRRERPQEHIFNMIFHPLRAIHAWGAGEIAKEDVRRAAGQCIKCGDKIDGPAEADICAECVVTWSIP